jgi:threonine dehydrogenase-like Zn-dependent dehydrogenase
MTFEEIVRRQWTIQGVHNYRSEDLVQAVEFMLSAQDNYPFEQLVQESFPLDKIEQAIHAAQQKENIRVAILPE